MLGQRLRQARLAAGLSLEGLAAKLDPPLTKQAISKYETGASQPPPSRLADLASALNIRTSSLLMEPNVNIQWLAYRKHATMNKARQDHVTAIATQRLEVELKMRELFHLGQWHDLIGPIHVQTLSDCEYAAVAVRMHWDLGFRPIDNLLELIEERGGVVITWPEAWGWDGLSGWADQMPVLVLNRSLSSDRLRFNAAHEIGHLVMKPTGSESQDEQFAMRFAAAFLVPAEAARRELGSRRTSLDMDELGLLKKRWGLSMQAWARRARDLDIISEDHYKALNIRFRKAGWHRREPVDYESRESTDLLERLVRRAIAEKMITHNEATYLAPSLTLSGQRTDSSVHSLRDLARRPLVERYQLLRSVVAVIDPDDEELWAITDAQELE